MASSPLVADINPLVQSLQQFTPRAREDRAMQLAGLERTADIENAALEQQQLANRRNQITTLAQESRASLIGDRTDLQLALKDGPNGLMNNLTKLAQKKDITPEEIKEIVTMSNQAIKDPEGAFKSLEANLEGVNRHISSVNEILSRGQTKTPFQKTGSFLVRNEDNTTGIATGVFDPNTGSLRTETTTFGPNQVVSRLGETAGEESNRKIDQAKGTKQAEADVSIETGADVADVKEIGKSREAIRKKFRADVSTARSVITRGKQLKKGLKQFKTGRLAAAKQSLGGIVPGLRDASAEDFLSMVNAFVLGQKDELLGGGILSDADIILLQTTGPQLGATVEGNSRIINRIIEGAEQKIDEAGEFNEFVRGGGSPEDFEFNRLDVFDAQPETPKAKFLGFE